MVGGRGRFGRHFDAGLDLIDLFAGSLNQEHGGGADEQHRSGGGQESWCRKPTVDPVGGSMTDSGHRRVVRQIGYLDLERIGDFGQTSTQLIAG